MDNFATQKSTFSEVKDYEFPLLGYYKAQQERIPRTLEGKVAERPLTSIELGFHHRSVMIRIHSGDSLVSSRN